MLQIYNICTKKCADFEKIAQKNMQIHQRIRRNLYFFAISYKPYRLHPKSATTLSKTKSAAWFLKSTAQIAKSTALFLKSTTRIKVYVLSVSFIRLKD